jgi:acyl-CoA synthetase (AMP-forming)/AMP-acid ligase II
MSKFNLPLFLTYLDIYRITFVNVVPAMLATMSKIKDHARFNLKALEVVGSGSAPLDPVVARKVEKMFMQPGLQIKQGWGMTETVCTVCGFSPEDLDDGRSIGWLNPNCAAKIVPLPDRDFAVAKETKHTVGEIWVAGPNIMKGYWKKPEATADTLHQDSEYRWLKTGDVGYIDDRGCLYIVDRIKVSTNQGPSFSQRGTVNARHAISQGYNN